MSILLSLTKSSIHLIFSILASLANISYVGINLGLKPFLQKMSTKIIKKLSIKHIQRKSCKIIRKCTFVNNKLATQRLNKLYTKVRHSSTISYHRPRLKSLKNSTIDGNNKIMIYFQMPTIPTKSLKKSAQQSPT